MNGHATWDEVKRLHELASNGAHELQDAASALSDHLSGPPNHYGQAYGQVEVGIALCERIAAAAIRLSLMLGEMRGATAEHVHVSDGARSCVPDGELAQ